MTKNRTIRTESAGPPAPRKKGEIRYTGQRSSLRVDETGRETLDYDNPAFPCALIVSDIGQYLTRRVPWHWHDDVELALITEGACVLSVNDDKHTLAAGDGYFINRNVLHSLKLNECARCDVTSLIFSPDLLAGGTGSRLYLDLVAPVLADTDMDCIVFTGGAEWETEAMDCLRRVQTIYETSRAGGAELLITAALARFWYLLLNHRVPEFKRKKSLSMKNRRRIKDMLAFIAAHYDEPLTLADIAAAGSVSERECTRCFGAVLGESPIAYLARRRVFVAAELLVSTDKTVTEICYETGFESPGYFTKIFKRHLGMTPKAYQKQRRVFERYR
ncbi:MAG: AraC family transcriptional regulator [Clostridiales Family XIII bacterium]|jgi:AraC-like DNA-binding protein|nr:AraC family transcriptional regulator [Clostridiales Family XIII bacterium]